MNEYVKDGLFHLDGNLLEWHRVDRVQEYKGIQILSLTVYPDEQPDRRHREYLLIWKDGHTFRQRINKHGGNIADLKYWIDYRESLK